MIAIDFSAISIRNILAFKDELKDESKIEDLIKHVIISSIVNYKKQFRRQFGSEVVIACDSRHYWRKDVFPYYKYKRKQQREDSDIPWDTIFKYINEAKQEIKEYFPWKLIEVHGTEADDVLGIMAKHVTPMTEFSTVLISTDKDTKQAMSYPNVKCWNPTTRAFATIEQETPELFLRELILRGDSSDGIPGVFSPVDCFVTGTRQPQHTTKKLKPMMESITLLDGAPNDVVRERIKMNAQLIDFDYIPTELVEKVKAEYALPISGSKGKALKYFVSKRMVNLIEDIDYV
jgi:hypothetical protein